MYMLGIDAGGTQTTLVLGTEDSLLATSATSSIKLSNVSETEARAALTQGIDAVCLKAKIARPQVSKCVIGLSGASLPQVRDFAVNELGRLLEHSAIAVYGDHVIAHRAAFTDGVGVITIAGTGSIAYGRLNDTRELRAGGHGPVISDEGSGTWIGRELLRRLFRAHDVGVPMLLLDELRDRFAAGDENRLVLLANSGGIRFSELVPYITSAASGGDELCTDLLRDAGRELAALAHDVVLALYGKETPRCAASGSVGAHPIVRDAFNTEILRLHPDAEIVTPTRMSAEGALLMAREWHP